MIYLGPMNINNIYINYLMDSCLEDAFNNLNNLIDLKKIKLIKFMGIEYLKENIKKNQLFLNNVNELNDPFDSMVNSPDYYKNFLKGEFKTYFKNINVSHMWEKKFREDNKPFYITCFSELSNLYNPKMWYLYADKYKGVCLEYSLYDILNIISFYNLLFTNLSFQSSMVLFPVLYANQLDKSSFSNDKDKLFKRFAFKHSCWKDENEWRIVCYDFKKAKHFFHIMPDCVYLGPKFDSKINLHEINNYINIKKTFFDYIDLNIKIL